jgi:DNA-binding MarR family transcriptional regulator
MTTTLRAKRPTARRRSTGTPLQRDARDLYVAMTAFLRFHQFRDRDQTGYHGLTITQCYVLECLHRRGALTLNELTEEMLLDKSTLSRIVDGLVAKDAVSRRPNPTDGRSTYLALTPAGQRAYAAVEADLVHENALLMRDTTPRQRRQFIAFLQRLTDAARVRHVAPAHD